MSSIADVILYGGSIITMDEKNPSAEALAVTRNLITAVAKLDEICSSWARSVVESSWCLMTEVQLKRILLDDKGGWYMYEHLKNEDVTFKSRGYLAI